MQKNVKAQWYVISVLMIGCMCAAADWTRSEQGNLTEQDRQTLSSFKKIDDFPLYEMRYYGDYEFDAFLKQGLDPGRQSWFPLQPPEKNWACTCFAALHAGADRLFGRNFDWMLHPALLLFTNPPGGYASVSMVDISYLGFRRDDSSPADLTPLLQAPYLPFDGMNARGLAVGMMALSSADGGSDPQKVTIGSLHVIRLLLDYAKDVEQAISLLQQYNVDFTGGPPLHYLIADNHGNSAIIEYVGGKMNVLRPAGPWQAATNFILSGIDPKAWKTYCHRYAAAEAELTSKNGRLSPAESMSLLQEVSQSGGYPTIWSLVYNMTSGAIQVVMNRQYEQIYHFSLPIKP